MNVISAAQWATRDDHGGHDMPSPFIPGRLRELRAEAGLSQAELAAKIGSDARQVSRYENGKVAPSLEAAVRIAETFNITLDYLLIPDAPRRPLRSPGGPIDAKLADLAQLTDDERATILAVIDAITTKARLRLITGNRQLNPAAPRGAARRASQDAADTRQSHAARAALPKETAPTPPGGRAARHGQPDRPRSS